MTKKQLERGKELDDLMNRLWAKKERLESEKVLCAENMDIAKKNTHSFYVRSIKKDGTNDNMIEITAHAVYCGICQDIKEIENELKKLDKEFTEL